MLKILYDFEIQIKPNNKMHQRLDKNNNKSENEREREREREREKKHF